jgi:Domain of unknown function (DUF4160)
MSSIRYNHLKLVIYPNDHPPPHVHVLSADWEIRIALGHHPSVMSMLGKPKQQEMAAALLSVQEKLAELQMMWRNLHG